MAVDYSVYLVTDSSPALLKGSDIVDVVEAAVLGGVGVVQLREKHADAAKIVEVGKRLHEVTKRDGIPLIINDRVDVALAVGAEGVHLGQDDLDPATARKILGPEAIIGLSVSTVDEAKAALKLDVDYLGIGAVHATPIKSDSKHVLGPEGVREILSAIPSGTDIGTVAIGGINATNAHGIVWNANGSQDQRDLDGVAVVSAIMGAGDPTRAAKDLKAAVTSALNGQYQSPAASAGDARQLVSQVSAIVQRVAQVTPLSHNMTNLVVQNFAANVALAVGGSPIMANDGAEAADLAQIAPGALVINMGSVDPAGVRNYVQALSAYNRHGRPVLLDPVGAGATGLRRQTARTLLGAGRFALVKGNESEIRALLALVGPDGAEPQPQQRGVDSGASGLTLVQRAQLAARLARTVRAVVLLTGATDVLTDGARALAVANGHPLLSRVTGSGCTLGTAVSCCLAVQPDDALLAGLAGVLLFELAAERAAGMMSVNGPGTFVPALLDKLAEISAEAAAGEAAWTEQAQVSDISLQD